MEPDVKKIISEHMRTLGKKGGGATKTRYGRDHFVSIAKAKKGQTWTWDPAKKGKRKKPEGLQSVDVIDTITPPETNS